MAAVSFAKKLADVAASRIPSEHTITGRMTGHLGGDYIEDLCETFLKPLGAIRTHDFLNRELRALWKSGKFSSVASLMSHLKNIWWWRLNSRTQAQVKALVISNQDLEYKQQDTADLMAIADGIVRLINVKSHDIGRKSRAPNIISTNKVLEFYEWIVDLPNAERQRTLNEAEVYFLSISWEQSGPVVHLRDSYVKRLSKLDVGHIPQLNFDAALQIQWHVEDMIECNQTPIEFARSLATRTVTDFNRHVKQKNKKFARFVKKLQ